MEKFSAWRAAALGKDDQLVDHAIEGYFRATAACFTDRDSPGGCFFICTSTTLSAASAEIATMLQQHQSQEGTLSRFLLARQQRGELSEAVNIAALARYLSCMLQGMSVRAREGAQREDLDNIIDTLMAMWPTLTGLCHSIKGNKIRVARAALLAYQPRNQSRKKTAFNGWLTGLLSSLEGIRSFIDAFQR